MSNIYIQEPPTNGKVLLSTSVGDIDIELWAKETPKACRNFVQLCMEGYYDGTIFHRVVPEFIVQGGDPTGSGTGGESIYGKTFRDEFHSRLRFVRRGLVAMANAGPNDNGSQFFFTLGQTPELNNKHTIFGKVAGDTIYNMLKLSEVDIGPDDRPLYPHKINRAKILSNPFDDIIPRRVARRLSDEGEKEKKKKSKSKATKNFSLLSFGEEAEEEEVQVKKANKSMKSQSKSSHDLLKDTKLSAVPALETKDLNRIKRKYEREEDESKAQTRDLTDSSEEEDNIEASKERIRKKLKSGKKDDVHKSSSKHKAKEEVEEDDELSTKSKTLEELKKEARRLKRELRATKAKEAQEERDAKNKPQEKEQEEEVKMDASGPIDAFEAFKADRQRYKEKQKSQPKKGSSREAQTMALLAKFQSKLSSALYRSDEEDEKEEEEEKKEEEEEKVFITEDGEEVHEEMDDGTDITWMRHKLKFESRDRKVLDANVAEEDRYEIYDPRNPLNKRRREASKQAMKGKR